MFNHRNPCWAKFVNFWTALLRMGLSDKEDCIYVMQHIPSIAANAWLNFCECKPAPTKDELCYIMEQIPDADVRSHAIDKFVEISSSSVSAKDKLCYIMEWFSNVNTRICAWNKFVKLSPSAEDFRYLIQWVPDMKLLAGLAWITTGITPANLVYVFEQVPEIQDRLPAKMLKLIILTSGSSATKIKAGMLMLRQSQDLNTLIFIKDNVPELESLVANLARNAIPEKEPVGFRAPQKVPQKKKKPIGF